VADRYNYFVREGAVAWQDTARENTRTRRHRGSDNPEAA
jgi:hypothetical protein